MRESGAFFVMLKLPLDYKDLYCISVTTMGGRFS